MFFFSASSSRGSSRHNWRYLHPTLWRHLYLASVTVDQLPSLIKQVSKTTPNADDGLRRERQLILPDCAKVYAPDVLSVSLSRAEDIPRSRSMEP
ncbi:hypothetical protein BaRGS_00021964 [Batillaria attramentaria]|uniref:Uncharacterized protein n=1 Tax=Batillaria attramentaria TaxID=370345 RepID=A0ABD0KIN8_9CAEN